MKRYWLVGLAMLLAIALYAPTLGRGLVNYDDPWLVTDNWIVHRHDVGKVFTDTSLDTRAVLGAEYLPVRDLSMMFDDAIWGDWYGGYHLTNLALYLAAIAVWFAVLTRFGLDRRIAGLAILIWAVHPAHAESVAWLSERKGLLAVLFSGVCFLGYARYRTGRGLWLVLACVAAVCAVWSKALAVFMLASLPALEWLWPAPSRKRAIIGIGAVGLVAALAFVPVIAVAMKMSVVSTDPDASASWIGIFGFYVRLAAMTVRNSVAYPITTEGASTVDIIVGALAIMASIAAFVPRVRAPAVVRAGVVIWLLGWFPVSRLVLPVKLVVAADRYLLFPSLGFALVVAAGIVAIPRRQLAIALSAAIVLAACLRTLDAQANWRDARTLWARAVEVSPRDDRAWSQYVEAIEMAGDSRGAQAALDEAFRHVTSAELQMRQALMLARHGQATAARDWMQRAAEAGEPRAMSNLALMLDGEGKHAEAIDWAKRAVARMPLYVNGYRILGRVTIASGDAKNALPAFERALALAPNELVNEYNVGIALTALGRYDEAHDHLMRCLRDPDLGPRVRKLFGQ